MFMRYRGGGVGHRYMRAIEAVCENMARERTHHKERKRTHAPPSKDAMDVDDASTSTSESEPESTHPQTDQRMDESEVSDSDDASNGSESSDSGSDGGDGDKTGSSDDVSESNSDEVVSEDGCQDESDGFADL